MALFRRQPERLAALNVERLAYFLDTEARGLAAPTKHRSYRLLAIGAGLSLCLHGILVSLNLAPTEHRLPNRPPLSVSFRQTDPGTVVGMAAAPSPSATAWGAARRPVATPKSQARLITGHRSNFTVSKPAPLTTPELPDQDAVPDDEVSLAPVLLGDTLIYPLEAIEKGQEGIAIVEITVDLTGAIVGVSLADTSGHPLLDEAAVNAVRKLGPLPELAGLTDFMPVMFRLTP